MTHSEPRARAIARHLPADGTVTTALPGVTLIRASSPTLPMPVVNEPTVCFVAQGRKRALLGTAAGAAAVTASSARLARSSEDRTCSISSNGERDLIALPRIGSSA